MKLYSYVVARDFGFAPNPFYGVCTLATCKPNIRRRATIGDWIIGTGSKRLGLQGRLVYAMRVAEVLTYGSYWADSRFVVKRPNLRGSLKQAYGDNIYYREPTTKAWVQADSHHSYANGSQNTKNITQDTQSDNVLIAHEFYYFGSDAREIPKKFRNWNDNDICIKRQGHKCKFAEGLIGAFVNWVRSLGVVGYVEDPINFRSDSVPR